MFTAALCGVAVWGASVSAAETPYRFNDPAGVTWYELSTPLMAGNRPPDLNGNVGTGLVYQGRQEGGQFGGAGGNYYNRASNTLTISLSGLGVYRTPDAGSSWVELNRIFTGREESEYVFSADPSNENRMIAFCIYGRSTITIDGTTWKNTDPTKGFDFGSVDWTDPQAKVMIAMTHTDPPPGEIYMSTNGGASWTLKGKWCHNSVGTDDNKDNGKTMLHVVNATTFLISNVDGIYRSTNSGGSWTKMHNAVSGINKTLKKIGTKLYAGYENGVLVCDADGTNWRSFCGAPSGGIIHGPMFGADETSMLAPNYNGLYKTTNSGASWTAVTPFSYPPKGTYLNSSPDRPYYAGENSDYKYGSNAWAWDYRRNIVYVGHMGGPMLKLQLPGIGSGVNPATAKALHGVLGRQAGVERFDMRGRRITPGTTAQIMVDMAGRVHLAKSLVR